MEQFYVVVSSTTSNFLRIMDIVYCRNYKDAENILESVLNSAKNNNFELHCRIEEIKLDDKENSIVYSDFAPIKLEKQTK